MRNRKNELAAAEAYGVKNPISLTAFMKKHNFCGKGHTIREKLVLELKKRNGKAVVKISGTQFVNEEAMLVLCNEHWAPKPQPQPQPVTTVAQHVESITASVENHVNDDLEMMRRWALDEFKHLRGRLEAYEQVINELRNSLIKIKTSQEMTGKDVNTLLDMFTGLEMKVSAVVKIDKAEAKSNETSGK